MGMAIKNLTPVAVAAEATTMTLGHQTNLMETRTAQLSLHRGPTAKGPNARMGATMVRQGMKVLTDLGAQEGQMVQVDLGDQEVQEVQEIRLVQVQELKR